MYKIILNMMFVRIGSISYFTDENSNEKIPMRTNQHIL